jgi:hypothetical protein
MRLPEQTAPVTRPPNFPVLVTKNAAGNIVEAAVSNLDPNDPAGFRGSSDIGQVGCHILSDSARCFAGRSRF